MMPFHFSPATFARKRIASGPRPSGMMKSFPSGPGVRNADAARRHHEMAATRSSRIRHGNVRCALLAWR